MGSHPVEARRVDFIKTSFKLDTAEEKLAEQSSVNLMNLIANINSKSKDVFMYILNFGTFRLS